MQDRYTKYQVGFVKEKLLFSEDAHSTYVYSRATKCHHSFH